MQKINIQHAQQHLEKNSFFGSLQCILDCLLFSCYKLFIYISFAFVTNEKLHLQTKQKESWFFLRFKYVQILNYLSFIITKFIFHPGITLLYEINQSKQGCYSNRKKKSPDYSLAIWEIFLFNTIEIFDTWGYYKKCITWKI